MAIPLIETLADVERGVGLLAAREPRFAEAVAVAGLPPLRRRPDGFRGLVDIVVSQQISVAAAAAILARLEAAGLRDVESLSSLSDAALKACGLSASKIRCLRSAAAAGLDFDALRTAPEEAVLAALTSIAGVGPWTAHIYLMFCLGRADAFAPGDLALQEAARRLFALDRRPRPAEFSTMAEAWSPWRAVAARVLWRYYAHAKRREGVAP